MSVYLVLSWFKSFKEGKGKRSDTISVPVVPAYQKQTLTSKKVGEIVRQNRPLEYSRICWVNPLNAELNPSCHLLTLLRAHHILHVSGIRVNWHWKWNCSTDFYITISTWKKVCSKMVPRLLTPKQKEIRINICTDILQSIENDPNIIENVITCDESWFFSIRHTK